MWEGEMKEDNACRVIKETGNFKMKERHEGR